MRKFRFLSSIFDSIQIKKVLKICLKVLPDYVIVNQQYDEDGLDYLKGALLYSRKKTISVMHMPMTFDKNSRPFGVFRGLILKYWYKKYNIKIVFVSVGSRNEFNNYYGLNGRYFVVNNGMPSLNLNVNQVDFDENTFPTLSFIGQINSQKNLSLLIQCWEFLNNSGIGCNLLIIGDGPSKSELIKQINNTGFIDRASLLGWTSTPEQYYSKIDVFVMTSLFEGLPLSLIEVAGIGKPCVVTPFNGSIDVANHAHWVRVSNSFSVSEISNLIHEAFLYKEVKEEELNLFRSYFSIDRVCEELINVF
jgi:glycosyltransferase involved in cell wall biosynthesis